MKLALVLILSGWASRGWAAAAFVPKDSSTVLERSRLKPGDLEAREIRQWREELSRDPNNLELAVRLAKRFLEKGRREADPRFMGHAQAALAPWWSQSAPPVEVQLLRAIVRQSNHEFPSALKDLEEVLRRDPQNTQAWLTKSTVLMVTGDLEGAKRACLPLLRLGSDLVVATALSQATSLSGYAEKSYNTLASVLETHPAADTRTLTWSLTALAEIAERRGQRASAEQHFRAALAADAGDPYLLAAFADFLLDAGRADEAEKLLEKETRADALLLRLALAKSARRAQLGAAMTERNELLGELQARFAAAKLRGNSVHRREEAMFMLKLKREPGPALELATRNWQTQREPADARILLECALAAETPGAARPAMEWLAKYQVEDVRLAPLVRQINDQLATAAVAR